MRRQSVTLKYLAEQAGCSIRTVNRVLKSEPGVNEEKRCMIFELANRYHYMPNMAARNLKTCCRKFVGILSGALTYEVNARRLNDLELRLSQAGWYPLLGGWYGDLQMLRSMLLEWSGIADYTIVYGWNAAISKENLADFFEVCRDLPMEFIFFERDTGGLFNECWSRRSVGLEEALQYFYGKGIRRILRCGRLESRREAFEKASENIPGLNLLYLDSDKEAKDGYEMGRKIMEIAPEVVFFDTDRAAIGFLNFAQCNGIKVPEQISVVGFDDDVAGRSFYPSLSTIAQPVEQINEEILRMVSSRSEENKPCCKYFDSCFIRRNSCI